MTIKVLTLKDLLYKQTHLLCMQKDILKEALNAEDSKKRDVLIKVRDIDVQLELIEHLISDLVKDSDTIENQME